MNKNIGDTDSWIRGLLGLELFIGGLFLFGGFASPQGRWAVFIASILIFTALCEYSPIYALLRFSTRNHRED